MLFWIAPLSNDKLFRGESGNTAEVLCLCYQGKFSLPSRELQHTRAQEMVSQQTEDTMTEGEREACGVNTSMWSYCSFAGLSGCSKPHEPSRWMPHLEQRMWALWLQLARVCQTGVCAVPPARVRPSGLLLLSSAHPAVLQRWACSSSSTFAFSSLVVAEPFHCIHLLEDCPLCCSLFSLCVLLWQDICRDVFRQKLDVFISVLAWDSAW